MVDFRYNVDMQHIQEKAILVGLQLPDDLLFEESMKELHQLALANGIEVVGEIKQISDSPTPNFYVGSGKVHDIKELYLQAEANLVIFNDELSPVHLRNLEKSIEAKIIDRTILILDIFAKRARTREAMLQVELAQKQYMLPRIIGLHASLSRQKSGVGSKGPGEQQIELDRRHIKNDISRIRHELEDLVEQRRVQRHRRKKNSIFTVAIAGYTNAGKSTLMNAILSSSELNNTKTVFVKDMPFATLETSTRLIELPNKHQFLITDTVGFVSRLPHHLVEAFKSTLEEINEADLIIHVVDAANAIHDEQIKVVQAVLADIGVTQHNVIYALNKIDLCNTEVFIKETPSLTLSAKTGLGLNKLVSHIDSQLAARYETLDLLIPFEASAARAALFENGHIEMHEETTNGERFKVNLPKELLYRWVQYRQDLH